MLELFLNTVTREWYDKDGNPFRDGMPRGAYQSREDVKITLCKETPDAGAAGVDVSTWTRDDSLASVSGVGAMLTIDSDRIHKLKGELSGGVPAGAVSTITATIENASNATVPESGTLRLFDETGDYEAIAYTDRSIVDGEATFTVSGSVSSSYAIGSTIDCDQSPYAQAYLDTSASNLEQGELVFHLVIDSQRLRAEMDYSDVATLSIAGLELLIYRTADGASEPVTAYLCETYSVTGTLGSVGNEAQPPDATEDKLAGLVDQLLAAGLDVEQQYDSSGNTQFRVRAVSAGGTWSDWITVQKGEPGSDGKSFSVDATGLMSERSQYDSEAAGFSFLATDEGNLYIKNSDTSGDWSDAIPFQGPAGADGAPGPANTLTIGTVTTGEPGTQAAASITGESPNQVLNLTIPRGDKGETGEGGGTADSVAWDNVTGKPSTFPPSSHTHKISDVDGLQSALDAKGTVKSVNGVEPDSSGNVTIETGGGGGTVDESRLLPDPATLSNSLSGSPVCYFATNAGGDDATLLLLHFDGTIDDSSSNRAQAQKIGNVTFSQGKFDKAAEFKRNSGGSYIKLPNSEVFNLASKSEWTIDGWVFLETDADYYCILAKRRYSDQTSFQIGIHSPSNKMYFYTGDDTFYSTGSVQLYTWTHFVFSFKNGTLKIWLNGKLDLTRTSVSFTEYDCDIEIGYHYSSLDEQFVGKLDELRLSSVDRTADETDKLYSADGLSYTVPVSPHGTQTKSYIVNNSVIPDAISAHNQDSSAHPDKLPLTGGTMTGELQSLSGNSFRMIQGEYGAFFRNDGRSLYLMVTDAGNQYGTYNSFRPLCISLSTGQCDISGTAQKAVSDGNGNNIANTYVVKNNPTFITGIEISGDTPFIDFKFNSASVDYTTRLRETASGVLTLYGSLNITGTLSAANMAGIPDYASLIDLSSVFRSSTTPSYSFTASGWVIFKLNSSGSYSSSYKINNVAVEEGTLYPVASGDTLSVIYETANPNVYFFPNR